MKKTAKTRWWNEDDINARGGWTVHFGPMLTADSLTSSEKAAQAKQPEVLEELPALRRPKVR
jgi:hypothetical protein